MRALVGLPLGEIESLGKEIWRTSSYTLITETGEWMTLPRVTFSHTVVDGMKNCLLIHSESDLCDAAVLVGQVWEHENGTVGYENIIAKVGSVELGKLLKIEAR
jgi:hypothetical protein